MAASQASSEICCLCLSLVTDATSKSKRKKLYNVSCADYKAILERLSLQHVQHPFTSFQETSHCDAYLCHRCINEVKSINDSEKALKKKIEKVVAKLKCLRAIPQLSVTLGQKRPSISSLETSSGQPTPGTGQQKRPMITPPDTIPSGTSQELQSNISVVIDYQSGSRRYRITDPLRKSCIRKLTFRRYKRLAGLLVNSTSTAKFFCESFGRKICSELAGICSKKAYSLLRDVNEAVRQFSWETVWLEFERRLPTLVGILQFILPSSSKAVLCFIIAIILKKRSPHMALVQRAVSVMLYANGAGKQVYKSLQPLMICLSHKRTIALVNRLSEDHDADVLFWAEDLKKYIIEQPIHFDVLIAGDQIDMNQFETLAQIDMNYFETPAQIDMNQFETPAQTDSNQFETLAQIDINQFNNSTQISESVMSSRSKSTDSNSSSTESRSEDDVFADNSDSSVAGSLNDQSYAAQETSMSEMEASFVVPSYSPIRLSDDDCNSPQQTAEGHSSSCCAAVEIHDDEQIRMSPDAQVTDAHDTVSTPNLNDGHQSLWCGYKIVIDNVDKNFRPSYQRVDHQTKSFHCVHMFASKDRIDFSSLSNSKPQQISVLPKDILPNSSELSDVKEHFKVLVSRVLVQRLEEFSSQKRDIQWHLPSKYSEEMSLKSNVVPLGIIDLNENRVDEMAEILDQLHRYVPTQAYEVTTSYLDTGEELVQREYSFHHIACTGDQLTVARHRTAKAVRRHSENELDRLEGLVPSVEDWHTKQLLVKVIWKWLYSKQSSTEMGTLYQLKNMINRTNVSSDPTGNLNACEDFLGVVLEAHIVAAAKSVLFSATHQSVSELAAVVVDNYLQIELPKPKPPQTRRPRRRHRHRQQTARQQPTSVDGIYVYGKEVLTLGLLWLGFNDAIKEGDGDKVFVYWKFLLLIFKHGGCRNYSIEAVNLLYQAHTLPPRIVAQLKWGRFINTHGRPGCNIPGDLHLEHLNRRLKGILRNLGPNNNSDTIKRAAKTVGVVSKVCQQFERETSTTKDSDNHNRKPYTRDFNLILGILQEKEVFFNKPTRTHKSFKMTQGHMQGLDETKLHKWLQEKIESIEKYY